MKNENFGRGDGIGFHDDHIRGLFWTATIAGQPVTATPGTIVRMPANVPHAVDAPEPARMLLVMLREPKQEG
jgi:quercetin dioxygenase-like cupin family protein